MAKESKSWLPKSNQGGWTVRRDSKSGTFVTEKFAKSSSSTNTVTRKIDLPNGDSITKVRRDVMDKALGRDGSKKRA